MKTPESLYVAVDRADVFRILDNGLEPTALYATKKEARNAFKGKKALLLRVLAWEAGHENIGFARLLDSWTPDCAIPPFLLACSDSKALKKLGMKSKESAGGLIVSSTDDPRVMLLFRRKGDLTSWKTPKGGIGRKETLKAAARREVREEAGLDRVKVLDYLCPVQYFKNEDGKRSAKTVHLFLMLSSDGECGIAPREGEHFESCEWLDFDAARARVTQPQVRGAIARARARLDA